MLSQINNVNIASPQDTFGVIQFDEIAKAMFQVAKQLGVSIRWGADWNSNGRPRDKGETDSPHFEI